MPILVPPISQPWSGLIENNKIKLKEKKDAHYFYYITPHSADIKTHFGGTPLNSLSLITISLEWVHELSSVKRILKYTVIKMHSASFFINGSNDAYKVARCVVYYNSVEKTDSLKHSTCS